MPQFKPVQISTPLIVPGAGPEQWHNGTDRISYPTESQPRAVENSLDVYYRFQWAKIEGATEGSYNFGYLEGLIRNAINKGQKFSFGIMSVNTDGGDVSYDGGRSGYPLWLHNKMKADTSNNRDFLASGTWIPNFNSPHYISALRKLHQAIVNFLKTTYYTPTTGPNTGKRVRLADAVLFIDIRGFGNWGEWHTGSIADFKSFPSGRVPTEASLKAIIDAHTEIFDQWYLVLMVAAVDGGSTTIPLFHPYPALAYYALTTKNAKGFLGMRKDQWTSAENYLSTMLENNRVTVNGTRLSTLILNQWRKAPWTGEPMPNQANTNGGGNVAPQVELYHANSIGNGNYGSYPSALSTRENIRNGFKLLGYKLSITDVNYELVNGKLNIEIGWINKGVAPTYEDWKAQVILSGGGRTQVIDTGFNPSLFLPSSTSSYVGSSAAVTLPSGKYDILVQVVDPVGYRQPMPLFIEGRLADGSYKVGEITLGTTNRPPSVNAGPDQIIKLPVNSVTLNPTASDPDGDALVFQWTRISPLPTMRFNDNVLEGLTVGDHVFELSVSDGKGGVATDQVSIKVLPADVVICPEPVPCPTCPPEKPQRTVSSVKVTTTMELTYSDGTKQTITNTNP